MGVGRVGCGGGAPLNKKAINLQQLSDDLLKFLPASVHFPVTSNICFEYFCQFYDFSVELLELFPVPFLEVFFAII